MSQSMSQSSAAMSSAVINRQSLFGPAETSTVSRLPTQECAEFFVRNKSGFDPAIRLGNLLEDWYDLEASCNSMSVGLVGYTGIEGQIIGDMISRGMSGAALPGAIVVLGHSLTLLARLEEIVTLHPMPHTVRLPFSSCGIPFEWPPILFVLDIADPEIDDCLRSFHALASMGIPVELSVHSAADRGNLSDRRTGFGREINSFFSRHLIGHFPKML